MLELFTKTFDEAVDANRLHQGDQFETARIAQLVALEQDRDSAFAAGKEEGYRRRSTEVATDQHQQVQALLQSIEDQLGTLSASATNTHTQLVHDVTDVTLAALTKLLPDLANHNAAQFAVNALIEMLKLAEAQPRLSVRTSHATLAALRDEGVDLRAFVSSETNVQINASDDMPAGSVKVEWENGWAEYDVQTVVAAMQSCLEQAMNGDPKA